MILGLSNVSFIIIFNKIVCKRKRIATQVEIRTVRTQYNRCRVIYFRDVYKCPSKCLLTLNNVL